MSTSTTTDTAAKPPRSKHEGPLDWRTIVKWLRREGVIDAEVAERTVERCSRAESVQHPLVRLGNVGMVRASDGKSLDAYMVTEFVAQHAGMPYLRIDPLKVDAGRVSEVMSVNYA